MKTKKDNNAKSLAKKAKEKKQKLIMTGMTRGICYACAEIVQDNEDSELMKSVAKNILQASGINTAEAVKYGVADYDLNRIQYLLDELEEEENE